MKFVIVALAIACAQARPEDTIVQQESNVGAEEYSFKYETSNGIFHQEEGKLQPSANSEYPGISAKGTFNYISPEGEKIEMSYVADENGFQPQGSYVPPTPEPILRALKYIAEHQKRK